MNARAIILSLNQKKLESLETKYNDPLEKHAQYKKWRHN
jgi:hypothetical protein